jgi:hypothetical protein
MASGVVDDGGWAMGERVVKTLDPETEKNGTPYGVAARMAAWLGRSRQHAGGHRDAYRRMFAEGTADREPAHGLTPRFLLSDTSLSFRPPEPASRRWVPQAPEASPVTAPEMRHQEVVYQPRSAAVAEAYSRARLRASRRKAGQGRRSGANYTLIASSLFSCAVGAGVVAYFLFEPRAPEVSAAQAVGQIQAVVEVAPPPKAPEPVKLAPPTVPAPAPAQKAQAPRQSLTVTEVVKQELPLAAFMVQPAALKRKQSTPPERSVALPKPQAPQPAIEASAMNGRTDGLIAKGARLMSLGDVAAARQFFERAAELGSKEAVVELARTYDPIVFERLKIVGLKPDPEKAMQLYGKARSAGHGEATNGILELAAWLKR